MANILAKIMVSSHFMDPTGSTEVFASEKNANGARAVSGWAIIYRQTTPLSQVRHSPNGAAAVGGVSPATVTGATHPGPGRRAGRPPGCGPPRPGPSAGGAAGGPPPPGRPRHGTRRRKWKKKKRMWKTRQSDYFRLRPGKVKCLRGREWRRKSALRKNKKCEEKWRDCERRSDVQNTQRWKRWMTVWLG